MTIALIAATFITAALYADLSGRLKLAPATAPKRTK